MNTKKSDHPQFNLGNFKLEPTRIYWLSGQELEELMKIVSLAASGNTAKRMYEAFYETDKVGVL